MKRLLERNSQGLKLSLTGNNTEAFVRTHGQRNFYKWSFYPDIGSAVLDENMCGNGDEIRLVTIGKPVEYNYERNKAY